MNQFNSSQQRVATYQDIEQQMQIAAIKYWASEGKTAPQITDILVTPHELSHGTSALVEAYSTTLGVSPAALSEKYAKAPLRYSADIQFVVSKDPMAAFRKVSGLSAATSSARGKTFGFEYFHGGLVPIGNVRISPAASQRETMIVFDSAFATQSREAIMNCINDVGELVSLSNHDPLHSINGRLADFDDLDCHYRYGGVEFAPIVMHSYHVQTQVLTEAGKHEALRTSIESLVTNAGQYQRPAERAYWVSVALRHLLLVVPTNHDLVEQLLSASQARLFNNQTHTVQLGRLQRFIRNNFSEASITAPPVATNAVKPFDYKTSILTNWFTNYFNTILRDLPQENGSVELPWRTFVLLDALSRGHGTYGIATAVHGNQELINLCLDRFRGATVL